MSERITRDDVAHVATLAKLALTDAELDEFTHQLAAVLDHAADVEALDVDDVPPTAHPYPLANVLRADVVTPTLDRDEVLAQAPAAADGRFAVPAILGRSRERLESPLAVAGLGAAPGLGRVDRRVRAGRRAQRP